MTEHVSPDIDHITALFAGLGDEPIVMLNLNRYRALAEYASSHPHATAALPGRAAYLHYGIVAQAAIEHVGGKILWAADTEEVVIGCDHDEYDEVLAVWYPSRAAFMRLVEYPGYVESLEHRDAALEQATLITVRGDAEPALRNPFEVTR